MGWNSVSQGRMWGEGRNPTGAETELRPVPTQTRPRLLFAPFRAWSYRRCLGVMTDIGSENPEDDILRNVGGMVCDAFEIPRHEECI
jgi:hypothetical protein